MNDIKKMRGISHALHVLLQGIKRFDCVGFLVVFGFDNEIFIVYFCTTQDFSRARHNQYQ